MSLDGITSNTVVIITGIVLIIAEMLLGAITGFELFVIGVIFIISGGLGMLTGSFSLTMISIGILAFLYIFVARQYIKEKLTVATHATNADSLVDKIAQVTKKISKDTAGQVNVNGEVWRAQADTDIAVDTDVVVESISGVTLKVKPKS